MEGEAHGERLTADGKQRTANGNRGDFVAIYSACVALRYSVAVVLRSKCKMEGEAHSSRLTANSGRRTAIGATHDAKRRSQSS